VKDRRDPGGDRSRDWAAVVAVTQLLHRYHHAIDDKRWDDLARLFVPGAWCRWPRMGKMLGLETDEPRGVEAIVTWLRAAAGPGPTLHHMLNTVVEIEGDRATSVSHVAVRARDGGTMIDAGSYTGSHVLTPEGWRIRSMDFANRLDAGSGRAVAEARAERAARAGR